MNSRSTNTKGYVHFGGDVVSGVEDGIGIKLGSASTGGSVVIEPLSDSDTAALTIRAKGAARLTIGDTSNALAIIGAIQYTGNSTITGSLSVSGDSTIAGNVTLGGGVSTGTKLAIKGIYSATWSGQYANLTSGMAAEITLTTAVGAIAPGDLVFVNFNSVVSSAVALMSVRLSSVGTSCVTLTVGNITSTAIGSTQTCDGTITWIDLT